MGHLDGNVLAGPIGDLLSFEPTTARGECAGCGDVAALAQAAVYGHPMGYVVRCRSCDDVLMVVVERGGRTMLRMPGLRRLEGADPV
ncbi:DUF6510 family protein [Microbacterium sp. K24]|jgi:ribosomal protein S27E|uniref:DUF6510 family protein n=1 Tax=Microbacterium sp. K24 TaxID=2305446 RepID=UPI00109D0553|nr:DUF6510 family protein [Microbacterium sp. K24]